MKILELFAEQQRPLAITEIAPRRLEFPLSSTFGLLRSLVSLGYLNLEAESHTYLPTVRLALLGAWVACSKQLDELLSWSWRASDRTRQAARLEPRPPPGGYFRRVLRPT